MKTRRLGRTGLEVSQLAFGGGVTGGILVFPDESLRLAALKRAVAAGINLLDTAPTYGDGKSEETIGRYLRELSPRPHVSSKFRLDPEDLGDIEGAMERSLEQSLKRLRLDRMVLLQFHGRLGWGPDMNADTPSLRVRHAPEVLLKKGGVADALDKLKSRGLIGACGFTAMGEIAACIEVADGGRFDTAQVYYNAINPSAFMSLCTASRLFHRCLTGSKDPRSGSSATSASIPRRSLRRSRCLHWSGVRFATRPARRWCRRIAN